MVQAAYWGWQAGKGNHKALENVYQAVRARVVALGSDNLPIMPTFWLRMNQLELSPKQ